MKNEAKFMDANFDLRLNTLKQKTNILFKQKKGIEKMFAGIPQLSKF